MFRRLFVVTAESMPNLSEAIMGKTVNLWNISDYASSLAELLNPTGPNPYPVYFVGRRISTWRRWCRENGLSPRLVPERRTSVRPTPLDHFLFVDENGELRVVWYGC